jgi:4-diphosphocytidyl-2-C-methyl-D-erythritol kinase
VNSISAQAYAKINLGLRILRKRPDGYHDIETVFHLINICDELTFVQSESVSLACSDSTLPCDDENLCMKAVRILQQQCNTRQGVKITLKKNIPVGAGLGGGSSDAATTLRALTKLWNLQINEDTLAELALRLGSDVPFFLTPGTAYATGRGEKLEYLPIVLPYWIVTAYPKIHISTAWAYSHINPAREPGAFTLKYIMQEYHGNVSKLSGLLKNDFEHVVKAHHPKVDKMLEALKFHGAKLVQLSGSGSSVYGVFTSKAAAEGFAHKAGDGNIVCITPPHFTVQQSPA